MPHPDRRRILTVVMLGYGLVQMGMVPVSAIMPTLSRSLGVPLSLSSWLLTGYLLVMTACILTAGRLGDRHGHKRIFLGGLAGYSLGALLAGLSGSFWPLLLARLFQGAGAGMVTGTALAWVSNVFPASHRGRVVGAVTLSSFIGGFISLGLASWAVEHASWQWSFLSLVGPGLLAVLLGAGIPEEQRTPRGKAAPLDWAGALVLGAALIAFSLGLNHLHEGAESWADGWRWHLPMNVLSIALAVLFVQVERTAADPLVPFRFFRNRAFVAAIGANLVIHLTMMGSSTTLPFLVQVGQGLTPAHTAGALMMLQVLSLALSPVSGWLYDKARGGLMLPVAMAIVGSGVFLFGLFTTSLSYPGLLGLGLYMGTGMGLFLSANNAALMSSVPAESRGFASGVLETTRQLGHALATTAAGTLLTAGVSGGTAEALQSGFRSIYWLMSAAALAGVLFSVWHGRERSRAVSAAAAD
jgi:MFS transporter, DHA2 family, methylenomycin A resistance protein